MQRAHVELEGLRHARRLCRYRAAIIHTTGVAPVTLDTALTGWAGSSVDLGDGFGRPRLEFIRPADWADLRTARLTALHESPEAFVASPECEEGLTPEAWTDRLTSSTWVVARDEDRQIVALASSAWDIYEPDALYIEGVWVRPNFRRKGVVRSMLKLLEHDAHIQGATRLLLWVLDTNEGAQRTYLKLRYNFDGEMNATAKIGANGSAIIERRMAKQILCVASGCPCRYP